MRSLKIATVVLFSFISSIALAGEDCKDKIKNSDILTPEQIEMRIRHCESLKEPRKALRATFTAEQKAIKKDKSLSRKEKKSKLEATFTSEQKAMKDNIKAIRKQNRKELKATLTAEQKSTLKARRQAKKAQ